MSRVINAATSKPFGPFASTTQFVRNQYRDVLGRRADLRRDLLRHPVRRSLVDPLGRAHRLAHPVARARAERPVRAAALPGWARAAPGRVQLPIASGPAAPRAVEPARAGAGGGRADGRGVGRRRLRRSRRTSGRSAGPPTPRAARTGCGGSTRVPRAAKCSWRSPSRPRPAGSAPPRWSWPPPSSPCSAGPATDDGLARWTEQLESGTSFAVLIDDLFRREEYAQRF